MSGVQALSVVVGLNSAGNFLRVLMLGERRLVDVALAAASATTEASADTVGT